MTCCVALKNKNQIICASDSLATVIGDKRKTYCNKIITKSSKLTLLISGSGVLSFFEYFSPPKKKFFQSDFNYVQMMCKNVFETAFKKYNWKYSLIIIYNNNIYRMYHDFSIKHLESVIIGAVPSKFLPKNKNNPEYVNFNKISHCVESAVDIVKEAIKEYPESVGGSINTKIIL